MSEQAMRDKAEQYIRDIRALGVQCPDLPLGYRITWETLGNLALILAGQRALKGKTGL